MNPETEKKLEWLIGEIRRQFEEQAYSIEIENGDDLIYELRDIHIKMLGYAKKNKIKRVK